MRVAIAGSNGYLGRALTAHLRQSGHEVYGLRRGEPGEPGVDWSPSGWVRGGLLEDFDALVALTGVSIGAQRWTDQRRKALRSSRVDATRTLAEHVAQLADGPSVFVSASAIGFYGHDRPDEHLDERSQRGSGYLADLVADWEAAASSAESANTRVVLLRTAPVLAPDSELIRRLGLPFKLGAGGTLGSGGQWFSWVALSDAVRAIEEALRNPAISGPLNVAAPNPVTNREFTRALGRRLRRPTLFPIPPVALRLVFGRGRANETLLADQRVLPRALETVGFAFDYPDIESALRYSYPREDQQPARARSVQ